MVIEVLISVPVAAASGIVFKKLTGPREVISSKPSPGENGILVMKESYWLQGIGESFFLFLGIVFQWKMRSLPEGDIAALVCASPFYGVAAIGLYDLFFRRTHIFDPVSQKITLEGFQLIRGKFRYVVDYAKIRIGVERGRSGRLPAYHVILHYPTTKVSIGAHMNFEKAEAALECLMRTLKIQDSQKNPSAKPYSWF